MPSVQDTADQAILAKCAICDMKPDGLVYFCLACRHGGHYHHLLQWVNLHRR